MHALYATITTKPIVRPSERLSLARFGLKSWPQLISLCALNIITHTMRPDKIAQRQMAAHHYPTVGERQQRGDTHTGPDKKRPNPDHSTGAVLTRHIIGDALRTQATIQNPNKTTKRHKRGAFLWHGMAWRLLHAFYTHVMGARISSFCT